MKTVCMDCNSVVRHENWCFGNLPVDPSEARCPTCGNSLAKNAELRKKALDFLVAEGQARGDYDNPPLPRKTSMMDYLSESAERGEYNALLPDKDQEIERLRAVVKDYEKQIIEFREQEKQRQSVIGEPFAWIVWCPKGHEHDYMLCGSAGEAQNYDDDFAQEDEEDKTRTRGVFPLYVSLGAEETIRELRHDINNAVSCAKKYQPDYPWTLNTASEAVWACGESCRGVEQACDEWRKKAEAYEKEFSIIGRKLDEGTLHVVYCNGNPNERVGKEGMICNCTLGREIKRLRHRAETAEKALKFYGNRDNYVSDGVVPAPISTDGGFVARTAVPVSKEDINVQD